MLKLETKTFHGAVAKAASASKPKGTMPVLGSVKLDAADGRLRITGTDLEVWVVADCPCEGEPVTLLLAADKLREWLNGLSGEWVTIELQDGKNATLRSERQKRMMPTADPKTFPASQLAKGNNWDVPAGMLRAALRTVHCADPTSVRFSLGGVLIDTIEGQCWAVALDGSGMATQPMGAGLAGSRKHIIPAASVRMLVAMLPKSGPVTIYDNDSRLAFEWEGVRLETALFENKFPNWRHPLPKCEPLAEFTAPIGQLTATIASVRGATSVESEGVDFEIADGELRVRAASAEAGEADAFLPVASKGNAKATFKPAYIVDHLKLCDADETATVKIYPNDGPCTVETAERFDMLIMPLVRN